MLSPSPPVERLKPLLGTFVRIRLEGLDMPLAHQAMDKAYAAIAEIHRLMSFHEPDSDVSRLNRQAWFAPVQVHAHTQRVLEKALEIARASDGLFDPTVAPALVRQGLLPVPGVVTPSANASWKDISLNSEGWVSFARPLWLDLGGIAKGYAVDCAVAPLKQYGALQICVEAGGDLRLWGQKAERVWLDAPGLAAVLEVENAAIASSGSQEMPGRSRVSPHWDTRSGKSCPTDRFATVIAPHCMEADALTKVAMAAGHAAAPLLTRYGAQGFLCEASRWHSLAEAA